MSQPYKSGRQQNLNLGISSVTENRTVLQTIGKVGIGTTNAKNHSLFVVGSTNITGDVSVGGASTFVGVGTFGNDVYIDADLYVKDDLTVDEINSRNINVTGVSTLGISSATTLYVSGVSTFVGIGTFGSDLYVGGDLYVKDDLTVQDRITTVDVVATGLITATSLSVSTNFDVFDSTATFHNNVFIAGNLSIGGTSSVIIAQDLKVLDKEITLGITTDAFGNDVSTDITANHGGIAIASTEGYPLVDLSLTGFSTLPATYKQIMWVAANSYGVGTTDAWMFNYAVGIGSTLVPNGTRLAVGSVHITDNLVEARDGNFTNLFGSNLTYTTGNFNTGNIVTGVVTTIVGSNLTYTNADIDNAYVTTGIVTTIAGTNLTYTNGFITAGIVTTISGSNLTYTNADIDNAYITSGIVTTIAGSNATYTTGNFGTGNINVGVVTSISGTNLNYTGVGTITTLNSTTSTLGNASASSLVVSGVTTFSSGIVGNLTGTASTASFATTAYNLTDAANIISGTVNSARLSGTYNIDISGNAATATYALNAGITTSVIGGIVSVSQLDVSGISTLGTIQISSGIITATSGVVTYYGDGSKLQGVVSTIGVSVQDEGSTVGTSVTTLNFSGSSVSVSNAVNGISTITIASGIVTYADNAGMANYATTAGVATALQNSRTFEITGDIVASPISFDGTGNVSLAATIQPNSVALGGDTTGNYVTSITNGSYITGADGGSEGSTLTIGVAATSINTLDQIVARDSSGNFSAGTITANLTGTASTASFATTAFNLSDAANITTGTISSARLSGTYNIDISGNAATTTYALNSGIATSVIGGISSVTQLQVTGVSTFTNGPVFIGSATSTGTASQPLQVTGGAYVSGSVGIGTTAPSFKVDIAGDARVTSTNKMRFGGTGGTTNFYIQYNSTANSLDFVAG